MDEIDGIDVTSTSYDFGEERHREVSKKEEEDEEDRRDNGNDGNGDTSSRESKEGEDSSNQPNNNAKRKEEARSNPKRGRGVATKERSLNPPSRSLHLRQLGDKATRQILKKLFSQHGDVQDVYRPKNYHTNRPQSFAFIEFGDVETAQKALKALNGQMLEGRALQINFAQNKRKTADEMRGTTREGGSRSR